MVSDMELFFNPDTVAVAGASKTSMKLGNIPIANMRRFGFEGRIIPIHPEGGEVMGLRAYPSLEAVEGDIDVAVASIPRERIPAFVEDCARARVRRLIVSAAGFADVGEEGAALQRRVEELVKRLGVRMMGPNSMGTVSTESGFVTSLASLDPFEAGGISIIAQTGLFVAGYGRWLGSNPQFGIAKMASLGNKGDIEETEVLEYLRNDPPTRVIAIYTEGLRDGVAFIETASRTSPEKPIVVLKGGSSEAGKAAAAGHTGSLAGEHEIYKGAFCQAGVVPAEDIDALLDYAKAFSSCPLPAGNRVGVISITGAGCVLAADACHNAGLAMPALQDGTVRRACAGLPGWITISNPADIWAPVVTAGVEPAYRSIIKALLGQDDMDMLIVTFTITPESEFDVAAVMSEVTTEFPGKPVIGCILGASTDDHHRWTAALESVGIPVYDSIERAVGAARSLNRYSDWLNGRGPSWRWHEKGGSRQEESTGRPRTKREVRNGQTATR